ncbi:hypothetical protein COV23_00900 [Candidatus Wolfebacteria bacterium CG10_big_fil_rev_8_21_14_0_10_31_9]|uniref:Uncharacterized protein n=1 Tax=Candidatus Wolfebacteria bacterium CG10_big_fil_rev_8_21_14_0_10_31_9 TaxID=1975070 RepID=A0A2H0RCI7_9BACT|nr:MAG: hypothetical protein COV23_00900 [Candidatus Wolfebacteria bacterium CG10_big_fil_rev_8_21_14_0_10_31_9]
MKKRTNTSPANNKKTPSNLIVAGDIHFDCNWDNIAKNVEAGYDFLNPNEIFRNFIKEIKILLL